MQPLGFTAGRGIHGDDIFARRIVKAGASYRGPQNVDDEYDHDAGLQDFEASCKSK